MTDQKIPELPTERVKVTKPPDLEIQVGNTSRSKNGFTWNSLEISFGDSKDARVNEFDEVEMDLNSKIEERIMPTKNGNMKDISRRT